MFDISKYVNRQNQKDRYKVQLDRLANKGINTERFQKVINQGIKNIKGGIRSFCIYGDPQSGKTEMMILLTSKLLDEGYKVVIILINDNVDLLRQNLERFSKSGLDPSPKNFREITDPEVHIGNQEWIIFCKKNSKDLQKLIDKIENIREKVIIDDEGDYATPNSKINKQEQTKIHQLVEELLGNGIYIGVTATPARLDLNNTFANSSSHWICLKPHGKYHGQDTFFPINRLISPEYRLKLLPDEYDDPKYLQEALFNFFINAAYLSMKTGENYCMLIHTSGKMVDHSEDYKQVIHILNILSDQSPEEKFEKLIKQIFDIANTNKNFDSKQRDEIIRYILDNIKRNKVVVMNSDRDRKNYNNDFTPATDPVALFTIAIGGNIVSRGVTFKNLLSMFFTRDVKHKIQQDTYIQRARMFGDRGGYLKYFELTIPGKLYLDWHRCFIFHRLSLQSVISGNTPFWIEDNRTKPVSYASIDKATVKMDKGEMSFAIFNYSKEIENILNSPNNSFMKLNSLHELLGKDGLPEYLIKFIEEFSPDGVNSLAVHPSSDISNRGEDVNKDKIERPKGFIGNSEMEKEKYPHAIHHIKIFFNSKTNKAKIFYRYINDIKFLKRSAKW
ncbi:MAG: Z1 domain-containing protein [Atribacterota bacterium]|nr:Z1 domain-containing protein [Atribacterota bacterium]